jgi:uncharacterized damage-inducible protein DinB
MDLLKLRAVAVRQLESVREQFHISTAGLSEGTAAFCPVEGMMTVAQHIAHAAQVIEWLTRGAFHPDGFDLDFEPQIARAMAVTSLQEARAWFERSITDAIVAFKDLDDDQLLAPLPEGPVMGGMPRLVIPTAIAEHTSHHRGALAVYARLIGIVPESPYGM